MKKLSFLVMLTVLSIGLSTLHAQSNRERDFNNIPRIEDFSLEGFIDAETRKAKENLEKYHRGNGKEPVSVKNLEDAQGLKIAFNVISAEGISNGNKIYYIRVLDPEGVLLVDHNESFTYKGNELNATTKVDLDYDGRGARIAQYIRFENELKPGKYTVEVYSDGFILYKYEFYLK